MYKMTCSLGIRLGRNFTAPDLFIIVLTVKLRQWTTHATTQFGWATTQFGWSTLLDAWIIGLH